MRLTAAIVALVAFVGAIVAVAVVTFPRPEPPEPERSRKGKLVVLVVFDQLRGDYLQRWRPLFGPNGFARLQREGASFTRCYYPYATTTTGPGHASMLTGACPDAHGIVNNNWMENGTNVYCAGHAKYELVPPQPSFPPEPGAKPRAEPKYAGTPDRLLSETVADVLKESHGSKSKVFGLSLKDRSAIFPTGRHPDGAYWFYGVFGTSSYYAPGVHPWVAEFNRSKFADQWFGKDWVRFRSDVDYKHWSGSDDALGEGKGVGQGIAFPHPTTGGKATIGPGYYGAVANSPYGNDLVLELTKKCVVAEQLGTRDASDLLVVSFSSNDLIGHTYGPDSQEVLDVTLRSDALIAELLAFLDDQVGAGQYLLAITADHGVCPLPEQSQDRKVAPDAARVDPVDLHKELDAHLSAKFGGSKAAKWVEAIVFPWVYLNPRVVKSNGQTREAVAAEAAKFLTTHPHVQRTFTHAELLGAGPESDEVAALAKRSFHPDRCGDVYVVLKPYCIPSAKLGTGTTHGSPHDYDRHVPLQVYGPGISGGERDEPTTPQAIASIFARWLKIRQPKDAAFPVPETLFK